MKKRLGTALLATIVLVVWPLAVNAGHGIRKYVTRDGVTVLTNTSGKKKTKSKPSDKPSGDKPALAEQPSGFTIAPAENKPFVLRQFKLTNSQLYDAYIEEACAFYSIPTALAKAVISAESAFNAGAVSPKGAQGLMQLMPATADEMFVSDAFDPRQNIFGGVRYLRVLANMFDGDVISVVAAYNAGPDAVRKAGGVPRFAETQDYVRKVVQAYLASAK